MDSLKKPKTARFELRCKLVHAFMQNNGYVTKQQIAKCLEWEWPKYDRQIRDIISHISKTSPIVSTSSSADGYMLAKTNMDVKDVQHAIAEINSRIEELAKRKQPLIQFCRENNVVVNQ